MQIHFCALLCRLQSPYPLGLWDQASAFRRAKAAPSPGVAAGPESCCECPDGYAPVGGDIAEGCECTQTLSVTVAQAPATHCRRGSERDGRREKT